MSKSIHWLPHSLTSALMMCAACSSSSPSQPPADSGGNGSSAGSSSVAGGGGVGGSSASSAGAQPTGGGSAGALGGQGGAPPAAAGAGGNNSGGGGVTGSNAAGTGGAPAGAGGSSSTGLSFAAERITVTGVRGTTSPVATSTIRLRNSGTTSAKVTGIALGGKDATLFKLHQLSSFPATLAAGEELTVTVELSTTGATLPAAPSNKDTGSVLLTASLTAMLESGSAAATVYGLILTRVNYEPTLGQILTTLGYTLNVGKAQNNWNPNSLPGVEAGTDEVAASRFVKAGAGNVELRLVARFSPYGALPFGWYRTTTGCPAGCTAVGTMAMVDDAQTSDKARMVNPPPGAGSMTSFDPGDSPFGLWVYSDQKTQMFEKGGNAANGDWDYSQDSLNTPANAHRFKSYPLKNQPNTYLIGIEEAANGDYQDYVFLLSNVTAVP